jgi:hypothetical protein
MLRHAFHGITVLLVLIFAVPITAHAESQWTQPTPEELSMTSQAQVPGAAAVYLYREETTDDSLHMQSIYVRLKVLTEAGKEYANVKLSYVSDIAGPILFSSEFDESVTGIGGRTIHRDGTVVPFSGKPYQRIVEKVAGVKIKEMVFTLPSVEVGSILEYRYKTRIPDNLYSSPRWMIQQDLFMRKGYFSWLPTTKMLYDPLRDAQTIIRIAYSSVLPKGADIKSTEVMGENGQAHHKFELSIQDIPPQPVEDYMPPISSFSYRVNFYYSVDEGGEYWKNEGKAWEKARERFIGSTGSMKDAVQTLVAPGDSDTVKLQKIYAAIMTMDNTDYSRQHTSSEDKAQGLKDIKTAKDIWQRKSGNDDQLTILFIALARATGMKAYDMRVTNRDKSLFWPAWLTLDQLDDDVAIVVLDGKEQFFDPGQRECPFGQMAWKHTDTSGLREMPDGTTTIATTPEPPYTESQTQRIADLTLNADGTASGTLQITWTGAPALEWRQEDALKDEVAVKQAISDWMDGIVPSGMKAELGTVDNLSDYEKPLVANFKVQGMLATVTAKRLILPSQFFETNSKPLFPQPARDVPVYFNHTGRYADAVRVKFPAELQVESLPKDDAFTLQKLALYHTGPQVQPGVILMRRSYILGTAFFTVQEYPDVKVFYDKVAADDQQPVVLLNANGTATSETKK